jgi:hypothetical protein
MVGQMDIWLVVVTVDARVDALAEKSDETMAGAMVVKMAARMAVLKAGHLVDLTAGGLVEQRANALAG